MKDKNHNMQISVSPDIDRIIRTEAKKKNTTNSSYVAQAVIFYYENNSPNLYQEKAILLANVDEAKRMAAGNKELSSVINEISRGLINLWR